VNRKGNVVACELLGPPHPTDPERGPIRLPFTVTIKSADRATLKINGTTHRLQQGEHTDWIQLEYPTQWRKLDLNKTSFDSSLANPKDKFDAFNTLSKMFHSATLHDQKRVMEHMRATSGRSYPTEENILNWDNADF